MHSLDADLYCLKGWGRNKLLKDEEIESSPNCFIIHLTFSKCWSLITNALKIRAVSQFKLRYISEPEHFHYLIISHSNISSFSTVVKGSDPVLFPLIWIFYPCKDISTPCLFCLHIGENWCGSFVRILTNLQI